jgi:type II secretion system protein F
MPEFTYTALDKSKKVTTGTVTARDNSDAAIKVRQLGYYPTQITVGKSKSGAADQNGKGPGGATTSKAAASGDVQLFAKKISRTQILLFTREMADLLDAGLPMDRAFSVLIDQTDSDLLRVMLTTMQGEIRAGQPLSEALKKYPREFPPLFVNMVRSGEISGQLASVMTRLADFMEKESVRRSQIMAALTYPMVLVSVAVTAVTFLLTFVIPKLKDVFTSMGSALPLPTVILLRSSGTLIAYWWEILIAISVTVVFLRYWLKSDVGSKMFDGIRLRLPIFGALTLKIVSARLVRTLGTLLGGGVPILDAMEIAASALGNQVATETLLTAKGGVRQGETLHHALESAGLFPPLVRHMTAVGEETGRLPSMLLRTADTLDFEVDNTMRKMTSMVEPLVVLMMGGFVGFIVLSILLPIFNANDIVK